MALPQFLSPTSGALFKLNSPTNPNASSTLSDTIVPNLLEALQWYLPRSVICKQYFYIDPLQISAV